MKKLREYIIKWTDGQKVRGINVTPYDVEECIRVYETDGTEAKKRSRTQSEIYIQIYAQSRLHVWYNVEK